MGEAKLHEWHRLRFSVLAEHQDTDVIAFETIPCLTEVKALLSLLKARPTTKAWISVSCSSVDTLCSGESLLDFVELVEQSDASKQVEAIGVNCSDPSLIDGQIEKIRSVTTKPIIIYPNGGNSWDPQAKVW
jgi:homocysteine S-methyltransferase